VKFPHDPFEFRAWPKARYGYWGAYLRIYGYGVYFHGRRIETWRTAEFDVYYGIGRPLALLGVYMHWLTPIERGE
jgi:hypothetical protein